MTIALSRTDSVVVGVINGTGAGSLVSLPYYWGLYRGCGSNVHTSLPGYGFKSVRDSVEDVERRLNLDPSQRCILVGHSQGGLVAAEIAARFPQVYVVSLGAPFAGTPKAKLLPTSSGHDMRPGSEYIRHLQEEVLPQIRHRLHSVYTIGDGLVPEASAHVEGAASNHCITSNLQEFAKRSSNRESGFNLHFARGRLHHIRATNNRKVLRIIASIVGDIVAEIAES